MKAEIVIDRARFGYHPELQGIRALAVLAVFVSHVHIQGVQGGGVGVDVFFALSGFLITTLLLTERARYDRIALGKFYTRRALRLYPALIAAVALVGVLVPVLGIGWARYGTSAVASLLYVNDFVMAWWPDFGPLAPTWSLAVEEQFYLIWPLVLIWLLARRRKVVVPVLAATVLVSAIAKPFLFQVHGEGSFFLPWMHADGLLLGALAAAIVQLSPRYAATLIRVARHPITLLGSGLFLVAAIFFVRGHTDARLFYGGLTLIALASTAIVVAVTYAPHLIVSKVLRFTPLVWLGQRSYGFYLYHLPVLLVCELFIDRQILIILAALVGTLLVTELSWRFVEQPALRLKRHFERGGEELPFERPAE